MRLLHQRLDHDRRDLPRREEEAVGSRDQAGARRSQMPMWHACQHPEGGQARRHDDGLREAAMTKFEKPASFSRRSLLESTGALVVSVGAPLGLDALLAIDKARAQGGKPPLMPGRLSSYIAINSACTVAAYFGNIDMAYGLFVSIGQMVRRELDVPPKAVTLFMSDTAT